METALRLGGRHIDVGQLPEEGHVVLADPAGNEFCVIEPGNNFLAGCGFLGEVACDGTRDVGLFWRDALGWPLVWDRDEETAVQSPRGGTKLVVGRSARGSQARRNHQRFDLAAPDVAVEVERLVAHGATEVGDRPRRRRAHRPRRQRNSGVPARRLGDLHRPSRGEPEGDLGTVGR